MKTRAFTLIELLVAISIISLLSSVVLASVNAAREKARIAAGRSFAAQVDRVAGEQAVGIWAFDECSGASVADRSGFGNPGTLNGSPAWSSDTPSGTGCSISFNGTTQSVSVGGPYSTDLYDFGTNEDFTLSAWVKSSSVANGPFVIDKRRTFGGTAGGYTLRLDSTYARPCLRIADSANVYDLCASTGSYNDGRWHHYVISADRAGSATFYTDGQQNGSASMAGIGNVDRPEINIVIGTKDGTNSNAVTGLVDDVRIFAKKLSASEAGALYAEGLGKRALAHSVE